MFFHNGLLKAFFAAVVGFSAATGGGASAREAPEKEPKRIGRIIRVELPIDARCYEHARRAAQAAVDRARKDRARLTLIFEFVVPAGRKDPGRGSTFGDAFKLADFISSEELNAVETVAFLPQPIQGHAVLAAIACQEIVMAERASLGAAGIDEKTIAPTLRSAYAEIAGRRRTVPVAIALGMLDPAREVLRVETDAMAAEFVAPDELAELKKRHAVKEPETIKRAGELGEFTGPEARRWGLAKYLASDRAGLMRALDLPAADVEYDPSLEGQWRAIRVDLKGPIRAETVGQAQRTIEQSIRRDGVNFVCLWIDSPGGEAEEAMQLVRFLTDLDPSRVRTVAYVPREALSDAAIVAAACDQWVVHPRAELGGPGAKELSADEIADITRYVRNVLAPRNARSWSLPAALIDPKLEVFRATRRGEVQYFCQEEIDEQPEPGQWEKGRAITIPGRPLQLTGEEAEDYRLTNHVVEGFAGFKQLYGLQDDPTLVEPGWADTLIQALASPGLAALLLLIGGAALYIELHTPGLGVGGFVAAVCFLLFFWSRYLGGTAGWLEASLFAAGIAFLLLEVFVIPGFGIFGLGGGAMVLASFILASQTFIWPRNDYQFAQLQRSLLTVTSAGIGLVIVAVLLRKRLARSVLLSRLMLEPPEGDEAETIRRREALADFDDLLGRRGTVVTRLMPGGKARFGDLLVDVLADGEFIGRGAAIEVVEVRGSRVLVKEVASG